MEIGNNSKQQQLFEQIRQFVTGSSGLVFDVSTASACISQKVDGKSIRLSLNDLEEVIDRTDTEGKDFIQVNFATGKKILITDTLIGFKPSSIEGADAEHLPRVVTTPDILSVFEAIQDAIHSGNEHDTNSLRSVFEAVVSGGEAVGFNLDVEKEWIRRIPLQSHRASA